MANWVIALIMGERPVLVPVGMLMGLFMFLPFV